jgi:hypothetical protein
MLLTRAINRRQELKQCGPKEESILELWTTMEDQYGEAAAPDCHLLIGRVNKII